MKIYITGHTSGLGLALYKWLPLSGHEVAGLSRTNGYDLNKFLPVYDDFDVYINNAYVGFKQVELLYALFEKNQHRKCQIVNIGSVSADGNYDRVNEYAVHKAALDKACNQLQLIDSECKVVQVKLGRMDTPLVAHRINVPKINPEFVAQYITSNVINVPNNILVKNITLDVMHSRRPLDHSQTIL